MNADTRTSCFAKLCVVIAAALIVCDSTDSALAQGNPLGGLERLKNFQTRRASSCNTDLAANGDARPIKPGETLTLAELDGPGVITHIWFTINHEAQFYSRLLTLRMYWDGEEHPSVECPIGDFFGIGHGLDKSFMSIPIRVTSAGRARNCYWPMPFGKSARITVTNESDKNCKAFFYYIDWQKHASLPDDTAYFHATYRQEYPCVMGRNYLLADIVGRGHYVGTIQSVCHTGNGWYGEGDDFFFIDGEKEPSLRGTGTEDYFCDAWGFREDAGPFYGTPLWEGGKAGARGTAYRFHIPDPVVFQKSLRAEIEHKGCEQAPDWTFGPYLDRDDLMSSVAFWYQTEPHKPWPALPAGPDRLPFHDTVLAVGWRSLAAAKHSEHPLTTQPMKPATDGKQLWFRPADEKGWLEIPFRVEKEITGDLTLRMTHSWDYGTYRVLLDGKPIGTLDLFNSNMVLRDDPLGRHTLKADDHVLRFECVGRNAASKGYFLGFDLLQARVPVYVRPAGKDLRELQAGYTAPPTLVEAGEFKKVYDPGVGEKEPWYINDHCIIQGDDKVWHMFGITRQEPARPRDEIHFAHATAKSLLQSPWDKQPFALSAARESPWNEVHLWAPHVITHAGLYYMFYCAGDRDHARYKIHLATSPDLKTWTRSPKNPMVVDGFDARDPFIMRVKDKWVMYYTANSAPQGGNHIVAYVTSDDLLTWGNRGVAYTYPRTGTAGGPTESPFVVKRGDSYYLFVGPRPAYDGTDVFVSKDPFHWNIQNKAGHIAAHAAEVVQDTDGKWYVSRCGWGRGGLYLAPLIWKDGHAN